MEKLSWNLFNESTTQIEFVEQYYARHGVYPEAVLADRIYRTRNNLNYCKTYGI
jgi:hypothetical protein